MTPEENARRVAEIRQEEAERRRLLDTYLREGRDEHWIAAKIGLSRRTVRDRARVLGLR